MRTNICLVALTGCMIGGAALGIRQDLYGLERYIEVCRATWISPWIGMPINVSILIIAVIYLVAVARAESRGEK